jgi:Flp pilus assembly protein protease CpaA
MALIANKLESIRHITLLVLLTGVAYYDLRFRIVPNFLTAPALVVGLVLLGAEGLEAFLRTIWLALLLTYPFFYGFQKGWMGGGDVKLVAVVSVLAGQKLATAVFWAGILAGGTLSLVSLAMASLRDENADARGPIWVPYAAGYALGAMLLQALLALGWAPLPSLLN